MAWNIKKAYRSRCLDRVDVNFKWHREALTVLGLILDGALLNPAADDADDADSAALPPDHLRWVRVAGLADGEQPAGQQLACDELAGVLSEADVRFTPSEWAPVAAAGWKTVGARTDDDDEPLPPDHLTWHRIPPPLAETDAEADAGVMPGEELPLSAGREALVAALATRGETRFTVAEWQAFDVSGLRADHYVCVGDGYFGPAPLELLVAFSSLTLRVDHFVRARSGCYYRPAPSLVQQLVEFSRLQLNSHIANASVCSECMGDASARACVDGDCCKCNFSRLWSCGLRPTLFETVDGEQKLREHVHPCWKRQMSWDMLKPGGDGTHGSADNELRHTVSGTLVDCLDAYEPVHEGWKPHRFHTVQAKLADRELDQNVTPSKVKNDSDWSENGEIVVKD